MFKSTKIETECFVAFYALLAVILLAVMAAVWGCVIEGQWYRCADAWYPPAINFFIPSFAHPKIDASDWYAVDERLVCGLWGLMVLVALSTPRLVLRRYFLKQS